MKEEFLIKRKLEYSIIPYLNCAPGLKKSRNFIFFHTYDYTKEVFTLMAGYGIVPIVNNIANAGAGGSSSLTAMSVVGIGLGICSGILKFAYGRESITQKVMGQKKLIRNLAILRSQVHQALADNAPGGSLAALIAVQKELSTLVNNNIQEGIYEFDRCFEAENIAKSKADTNRLLQQFNLSIKDTEAEVEEIPDQIV
ncbi:MAG TPA: hypothetical protein VF476_08005 [Chitinophagaceae bacterium]